MCLWQREGEDEEMVSTAVTKDCVVSRRAPRGHVASCFDNHQTKSYWQVQNRMCKPREGPALLDSDRAPFLLGMVG